MHKEALLKHFLQSIEPRLSKEAESLLRPHLRVVSFPKKQLLVREGEHSKTVYWIVQGAVRSFYIHKSKEVNTWFAFEEEVAGSLRNFSGLPARESLELLEDSTFIALQIEGLKNAAETHVELTHFVYNTILEYALYLEDKVYLTHLKSAKERFQALLEREPEVFQRVSLTHISSFLGVSRETLSRLRAKQIL